MASLATGSCNFPSIIYMNPPDLILHLAEQMRNHAVKPEIEVFDVSMLYQALRLADEGVLSKPLHVQFVFGIKNAMPAIWLYNPAAADMPEFMRTIPTTVPSTLGIVST